jgi:hypothetical protein
MREYGTSILIILAVIIILFLGYQVEIYRWHAFQQVTNSDISFWKWQLLFNNHK